jgi:hypothetical protein
MAPSRISFALLTAAGLLLAGPALAQFNNIFRDEPPRPPANVPAAPPADGPYREPYYRNQAPYYPSRDYSPNYPANPLPRADVAPARPMPAPMSLPPQSRPGRGGIQSQDLAPPPGTAPSPQANVPRPQQGQQQQQPQPQQGRLSPLPNAPSGQPPAQQGAPQQNSGPPPSDEVVVEPPPQRIENPTAVFAGLDKITGRIISFDVAINETVQFGALQVTPKACYSRPPTETPQTDAFVAVDEVTLKGEIKRIFTGWMFAASPGLHAVEHPIYDVWLTDCKGGKNPAVADVSADEKPPAKPKKRQ